jgi:3-oxoacyl-[acyl-carrier protein] reductase
MDHDRPPLHGRVALVTGCSRRVGIGRAVAARLAAFGADLLLHGHRAYDAARPWGADADGLEALAQSLRQRGRRIETLDADLSGPGAPEEAVDRAAAAFGHLDIVVANHAHSTEGGLGTLTADDIDRHLAVNIRATLLLVQAFAERHDGRSGGRIVLVTSGQHRGPMPGELAYVASKGALDPLTTSLSAHLAPHGITVNAVNPGATDTGSASPALHADVLAREPQGRWGRPEDAARLIAWLCTDDACWVTGQVIDSTGGGP